MIHKIATGLCMLIMSVFCQRLSLVAELSQCAIIAKVNQRLHHVSAIFLAFFWESSRNRACKHKTNRKVILLFTQVLSYSYM